MMRKLIGLLLLMSAGNTSALMLTLDDTPRAHDYELGATGRFSESGFTMAGWSYTNAGAIHLDDSPVFPWESSATISGSKRFDAFSLNVIGLGTELYYDVLDPETGWTVDSVYEIAYPNVLVQGLRDGVTVAEARFHSYGATTYRLPKTFTLLDALVVSAVDPHDSGLDGFFQGYESHLAALYPGHRFRADCTDYPCGHFDLDAVEVSPAPVPAPLALLAGALALGTLVKRRIRTQKDL